MFRFIGTSKMPTSNLFIPSQELTLVDAYGCKFEDNHQLPFILDDQVLLVLRYSIPLI